MESIMALFAGDSLATYLAWATAIVTAASAIAAVTPNKTDDSLVAKFAKVVNWAALNFGHAKNKDAEEKKD